MGNRVINAMEDFPWICFFWTKTIAVKQIDQESVDLTKDEDSMLNRENLITTS